MSDLVLKKCFQLEKGANKVTKCLSKGKNSSQRNRKKQRNKKVSMEYSHFVTRSNKNLNKEKLILEKFLEVSGRNLREVNENRMYQTGISTNCEENIGNDDFEVPSDDIEFWKTVPKID